MGNDTKDLGRVPAAPSSREPSREGVSAAVAASIPSRKWTSGRWRAVPWSSKEYQIIATDGGKKASVTGYCLPGDAFLIAAAPELFEACAEFVRKVDAGEAKSTRSYAQMKAALASAAGARQGHDPQGHGAQHARAAAESRDAQPTPSDQSS